MAQALEREPVHIAGAGSSGLAVAWGLARRGIPSEVFDPLDRPGGMARTRDHFGLPGHAGVHLLHPSGDGLRPLVHELAGLMGPTRIQVQPRAQVHFLGQSLAYPFRVGDVVRALGPLGTAEALTSALSTRLWAVTRSLLSRPAEDSFETVVRRAYGDRFYALFFRDYTAKVLGVDPARIDGDWGRRRVPMPTVRAALGTLWPLLRPRVIEHAHTPYETLQLTGPEGLTSLFSGVVEACAGLASVRLLHEVRAIEHDGRAVRRLVVSTPEGGEESIPTSGFVSTMPLPELARRLSPAPPEPVRRSAARLRYRGLLFVWTLLDQPRLFDAHWTYFQDPELVFNRVSEYGNILPGRYGNQKTLVCAEVTADPGDALWESPDERLVALTYDGLRQVVPGLKDDRLIRGFVERERFAYPCWHVGYALDRRRVLDYVAGIRGLLSTGRQGSFDYLNIDQCFDLGLRASATAAAWRE